MILREPKILEFLRSFGTNPRQSDSLGKKNNFWESVALNVAECCSNHSIFRCFLVGDRTPHSSKIPPHYRFFFPRKNQPEPHEKSRFFFKKFTLRRLTPGTWTSPKPWPSFALSSVGARKTRLKKSGKLREVITMYINYICNIQMENNGWNYVATIDAPTMIIDE